MVAMTYIISSAKAGKSITTKDPLKDNAWGNAYYGVDDCVVSVVAEPDPAVVAAEEAKQREIAEKKSQLALSDYKILKKLEKLLPVDDVDVIERQGKRDRINQLEA
jgi:phage tail tube protein FII